MDGSLCTLPVEILLLWRQSRSFWRCIRRVFNNEQVNRNFSFRYT